MKVHLASGDCDFFSDEELRTTAAVGHNADIGTGTQPIDAHWREFVLTTAAICAGSVRLSDPRLIYGHQVQTPFTPNLKHYVGGIVQGPYFAVIEICRFGGP